MSAQMSIPHAPVGCFVGTFSLYEVTEEIKVKPDFWDCETGIFYPAEYGEIAVTDHEEEWTPPPLGGYWCKAKMPRNWKPKKRYNKRRAGPHTKKAKCMAWMDEPVDDTDLTSEILDALAIQEGWMVDSDAADLWEDPIDDWEGIYPPVDERSPSYPEEGWTADPGADDPEVMDDNDFLRLCVDTYALLR